MRTRRKIVGLMFGLTLLSHVGFAATTNFFYAQDYVSNIAGRVFADKNCTKHLLNMSTYGLTTNGVAGTPGWAVGDFTGLYPPSPVTQYQRGIKPGGYGWCAVQMAGYAVGTQVHTFSIPGGTAYNNYLANAQVKYRWVYADNVRPWAHSTSKLNLSGYIQVPGAYMQPGGT